MHDSSVLQNGARIAVIGGGPSGSFFSIFALRMAKMIGKDVHVTIYEPKDFTRDGPQGCNRCGGVISELLVQTLAMEGINLPEKIIQRGIDSYKLYTDKGQVAIETPTHEKTIATIYRGGGPKGTDGTVKESFDKFLLNLAVQEGAVHKPARVEHIIHKENKPSVITQDGKSEEVALVVGAVGVNSKTTHLFEEMHFGYKKPEMVTAAISELEMNSDIISEYFGSSIQLFLLPFKNVKFAAMIPKGTYVTLCLLGKHLSTRVVDQFLHHPVVRSVLPPEEEFTIACRCLPNMNIRAPKIPFTDKVVICGDAGSTRLFKDGLGAAYITGKAAAKAAILHGISAKDFHLHYYPAYKSLINDNDFGKILFTVSDMHKKYTILTRAMLRVIQGEQSDAESQKVLSSILWDMFTGNERYKNIFKRSFDLPMQMNFLRECVNSFLETGT